MYKVETLLLRQKTDGSGVFRIKYNLELLDEEFISHIRN